MYNKSDVCAVIVSYNIGTDLLKCFNSIYNQVNEVVIVDNGSNMETISVLNGLEQLPNVKIFYNKENRGIAVALNQGVRYAINKGYDWVLTLDHDSKATPEMIERMLGAYNNLNDSEKNDTFIIVPRHVEERFHKNINTYNQLKNNFVITEITSGNLVKTATYREIGFMKKLFTRLC